MAKLMRPAQAGTMESNDIMIMLTPLEEPCVEIELDSNVIYQFGDQIRQVMLDTLKEQQVENVRVDAVDKGALDITVRARLLTALERAGYEIKEGQE